MGNKNNNKNSLNVLNESKNICSIFTKSLFTEEGAISSLHLVRDDVFYSGYRKNIVAKSKAELRHLVSQKNEENDLDVFHFKITEAYAFMVTDNVIQVEQKLDNFSSTSNPFETSVQFSYIVILENDELLIKSINVKILRELKTIDSKQNIPILGGLCMILGDDRFSIANTSKQLHSMLGYDSEKEMVDDYEGSLLTGIPEIERGYFKNNLINELEHDNCYRIQHHLLCKDGSYVFVINKGKINTSKDGRIEIISTIYNKNVNLPIYSALETRVVQLNNLIEMYSSPIFFVGIDGRFLDTNRAFLDFFNIDSYFKIIGKTYSEIFDENLSSQFESEDRRLIETEEKISGVYNLLDKNGNQKYFKFTKNPIYSNGELTSIVVFLTDITNLTEIDRLNKELQQNETEIEYIFKNTKLAYFVKDNNLRFTRVNKTFIDLFDLEGQDVIGKRNEELDWYFKDVPRMNKIANDCLENKKIYSFALEFPKKDGSIRYITSLLQPLIDKKGNISGLVNSIEDSTEMKLDYDRVRTNYNNAIRFIEDKKFIAYMRVDLENLKLLEIRKSTVNVPDIDKIINYDLESVEANSKKLLYENERLEFIKTLSPDNLIKNFRENSSIEIQYTARHDKNKVAIVRLTVVYILNPTNQHREVLIKLKDITEEIETKALLMDIADSEYDFISYLDFDHKRVDMITINSPDFNFNKKEKMISLDRFIEIVLQNSIETKERINEISMELKEKIAGNNTSRIAINFIRGKRKEFKVRTISKEKGLFVVLCNDITELTQKDIQLKKKLADSMKKAQIANNVKSEFLASMSHDMRTPLNGILGLANFGMEESKDPKIVDYFSKIKVSSFFLYTLLNDVLDIQSIEQGKITIKNGNVDLYSRLSDIESMLRPRAIEKNIKFTVNRIGKLPHFVHTDGTRFTQILVNIISNAIKYTPEKGYVTCNINNITDTFRPYLRFEISDNGYGMSKKFQRHMFESFSTEKNKSSAKEGGTGLGLSIVKNLTELMGGTVECKSTLNVGTTFILKLPLKVISKEEFESAGTKFELQNFDDLKGKHILICEDNYLNTVIVKKILEKRGITTDTAVNGQIGVEKAKSNKYDAILMDIRMPVMDGLEAASKIREFNATIPIIALSANAYKEDINNSLDVGMNMHLVKPIEVDKLFTVLQSLIES